ncbi:cell wall hydrolase [Clostridium botulinum C]|uniref:Cell wall hydrolase n=5 Tax=Clostridium TaxID=1485 RepID=A0A9Q4TGA3_CLOBO|nr:MULTISPECIES: cell wall hydrolase [Clostridium]EGO88810.1 hydrolase [Clostridium botulinum C str. Stockholm]AYF53715.1 cell wall hydrolase [Clostridium novyi]EES91331.1 spore cortex-lytic enzyme [Clostridium botulinum D str. 1873]KEI08767.1 hydrolase [Clostridium sp. K25]KEI17405.1 hydrolase [Clostridium novyi B str. ATCC 27606]
MKKILVSIITLTSLLTSSFCYANARVIQDSEAKNLYKEESQIVTVFNSKGNNFSITKNDINLMAQIVYAESCAEPYEGKVAVASVILNRLKDSHFPNNIESVVKQRAAFSCVRNGKINVIPDKHCFNAVMDALKGKDPTNNAVFFYNPKIATSTWMKNINKHNVKRIGNHVFFIVK